MLMIYAAIGIALGFPLLFLFLLNKFDLMGTGKLFVNILTIFCGILAYYVAAQINPAIINAGWATRSQVIRITAPFLEEILKDLILIYLVQRADFNYVVDGAIYGFGAGIGFAIIENVEYITGHPELAMTIAIVRVLSTNLVHATASGLIGTALAYRRGDNTWRGWAVIFVGYLFAITFHMGFNTMVSAGTFLIFAIMVGVVGVGIIWYIIRRGLTVQKQWVAEKLGMTDRITKEEMKVVSNIETVNEILSPVEKRFGKEKATLVRNLIYKQAEIGIKRKLIDSASSENRKLEIGEVIANLNKDVAILRKDIGPYCMMLVRTVYLENDIQIWTLLNARVAAAGLGQKGGGLWNTVSERIKNSSDSQENNS